METIRCNNITVLSEYEVVFLDRKGAQRVVIGDHYGDPVGATIASNECWVMSYGEGIQVYFLREPFRNYHRGTKGDGQWDTWPMEGSCFVSSVRQVECNTFEATLDGGAKKLIRIDELHGRILDACSSHRQIN